MKKKIIFLVTILLVLFVYSNVYAEDGWITENGNTYYYENNIKVSGFKEIDGKLYFFSRVNNVLKKGWQNDNTGKWYQNNEGEVVKGIQSVEGKTYYFNDKGFLTNGFVTVDGKIYFFSRATNQLKTGWQNDNTGKWYQNENGELVIGLQEIDGKKYYFNEKGMLKNGFIWIDEKLYFFSRATNQLKTGWQNDNNGKWYQNEEGEVLRGLQTIDGEKYYFNNNGLLSGGFVWDNDKLYFFSRVTYKLKTGWQNDNTGKWYQNSDGEVLRGLQTIDGEKYYFNDNGILSGGFARDIDNKLYFFSRVTYKLKTGWQNDETGKWYQNKNGEVVIGLQEIDGKKYFFNEDGLIQKGFITIDGKIYFFSMGNYALKTGWQHTAPDTYWYQDSTGALVTGPQTINGRNYVFNEKTGLMEGFVKENNKLYYYDPDGTLNKGVQYMTDQFWKFDASTGVFDKYVRQIRVIDISTHNGVIDWNKVKASNQVDGVILRLGYGQNFMDSRFLYNKSELERLGIPYSVYLFSYAENKTEAQKEADFVVRTIQNEAVKIASNIFAVYYDLEDWEIHSTGENSYGISQDTYGEMITTFVRTIENNLGVRGRVYASKNYIETRFPSYARDYATWVAQWNDTITYKGNYEGWQYTSTGSVPGINGNVDMNIFYY